MASNDFWKCRCVQLLQKGFAKNPNKKKLSDILVNILITMKQEYNIIALLSSS